ncbi:MAG: hypothetical protein LBC07_02810, partial [Elusimicrobiota bacterium]|nr:hypothetical protein [Elusimicrobiota bacterium]
MNNKFIKIMGALIVLALGLSAVFVCSTNGENINKLRFSKVEIGGIKLSDTNAKAAKARQWNSVYADEFGTTYLYDASDPTSQSYNSALAPNELYKLFVVVDTKIDKVIFISAHYNFMSIDTFLQALTNSYKWSLANDNISGNAITLFNNLDNKITLYNTPKINFQNGILIKVYQYKDYFNLLVQVIDAAAFKAYNADRLAQ